MMGYQVQQHVEIIAKLDESAKLFRILILKTLLTIIYTSIFIQSDCGYWTSESEAESPPNSFVDKG